MRIYGRFSVFVALFVLTASAVFAQSSWVGNYVFGEDGGKTAGGTAIFITHELTVMDGDDGLAATLQANGYQTSKDLICTAKGDATKLEIYFDSYGESNVFESYKKGDLLLTLERKKIKGKDVIVTNWGKYTSISEEKPKNGMVRFVKSDTIETGMPN
jgi:hypothetical protein